MTSTIDKMQNEALSFMAKRKKIEEKRMKQMEQNNKDMYKEIIAAILLAGRLNISAIPTFIQTTIKPIVDKYRIQQQSFVDGFIRDDYKVGIETGQKLLQISSELIDPYNSNLDSPDYSSVLNTLLNYAESVVDSQHNDLISNLGKNMSSIYIINKRLDSKNAEKQINTDNSSTTNTILSGAVIGKYINSSFKNINYRTNLTAQNESNRALNHGILMRYIVAKRDNLPKLMTKWIEVNDEKLCSNCRAAAEGGDFGTGVYAIGDITPPPLHSSCRCILVPFLSSWENSPE